MSSLLEIIYWRIVPPYQKNSWNYKEKNLKGEQFAFGQIDLTNDFNENVILLQNIFILYSLLPYLNFQLSA